MSFFFFLSGVISACRNFTRYLEIFQLLRVHLNESGIFKVHWRIEEHESLYISKETAACSLFLCWKPHLIYAERGNKGLDSENSELNLKGRVSVPLQIRSKYHYAHNPCHSFQTTFNGMHFKTFCTILLLIELKLFETEGHCQCLSLLLVVRNH